MCPLHCLESEAHLMALLVHGTHVTYTFTGPFEAAELLENRPGIFLILERRAGAYALLDLGESAQVQTSVLAHPHQACWVRQCRGTLANSAAYPVGASTAVRRAM